MIKMQTFYADFVPETKVIPSYTVFYFHHFVAVAPHRDAITVQSQP